MQTSTQPKKRLISVLVHACCCSLTFSQCLPLAYAGPTGGQVVGGSGAISQSGANTTINQSTQNMAINWQSYNVNVNERVQYIQPNSSSISLNTILSNNGSTIAGRIDANGRVILVNPNGIFFTSTASLNVGSIIASGLNIKPADFMNGKYIFNEIPGSSGAVINNGMINASLGGNVVLIGKHVENNGLIVANLGTVSLAAGKQAVLTFDNGGLLGVRVSQEILQSELGVDPAVINSGEIQAQGGRVLLTASVSKDIFSQAVNANGMQQATSVMVNADGSFTLGGGADVMNSGTINTSTTSADQKAGRIVLIGENVTSSGVLRADAENGNGGEIELHSSNMTLLTRNSVTSARSESNGSGGIVKVLGDKVGLFDQSTVDVSGANGGGQALIGGDFQGKNQNIRNATATIINPYASVYADALGNGDGGKVIVWSDGNTYFLGNIHTRGGSISGDGGFVETSGKENLLFNGFADRTAANGANGVLLLDPRDLNICSGSGSGCGDDDGQLSASDRNVFFSDGSSASDDFSISADRLVTALGGGSVILQATRDISVNASIAANSGNTNSLTLLAGDDVTINQSVNLVNGNLTLVGGTSGCGATCSADSNPSGNSLYGRNVRIDAGINTTGSVTLLAADNVTINDTIGATARPSALTVRAGNNITVDAIGSGNSGAIITNGAVSLTAADVTLATGASPLTVAPNSTPTGTTTVFGNVSTNDNDFTATTTAGYFDNWNTSGGNFSINAGAGAVSITANGNDGGATPIGALLGKITAGSLDVTTTTGQIVQSSTDTSLNLDIANTTNFNAGSNPIDLQNAANSLRGTIALTTTGTANNVALRNSAINTILGTVNIAGTLAVNATRNLAVTNAPVTSAGDMTLTFGTLGTGSYSFCYLASSACANSTTVTGPTLTSTGGNINVLGGAGADTFNLAGLTLSTPTSGKLVSLTGAAGSNTVIGQNSQTAWDVTTTNVGTLVNAQGTVSFTGIENLTGGSGNDTFTVNPSAMIPTVALSNLDTGSGTNTVTVNANANVSGTVTTGSGTNTVTVNGTVASINGTTGNGTNTINVNTGGAVSGTITTGSGADVFNITGTVGGQIDGGDGSDILAVLTAGRTVKLGTAVLNNGYVNVDRVETINATGTGNILRGQDNNSVLTSWNISAPNQGTVAYTSNTATTVAFSVFDSLTGGTGADTFAMGALGTITGTINGGLTPGANTLIARQSVANTWAFSATPGSGSLTQSGQPSAYVNQFSNIQNYVGGGTNADWANFSGIIGTVDVNAGSYLGFAGIIGNGASSTLNGENGRTNNWRVQAIFDQNSLLTDGLNDGVVNSNTANEVRFISFGNLVGGDGIDNFVIDSSGSFAGTINGAVGANTLSAKDSASAWNILASNSTLTYDGITTYFNIIQSLTGSSTSNDTFTLNSGVSITGIDTGGGNNTVTINTGGIVTGAITGRSGVDTINVSGTAGSIDTGDGATNSVSVAAGGSVVGAITGGAGADNIQVNGIAGSINAGAGNDTITLGANGNVAGLVDGSADSDTLDITAKTAPTVQLGNTLTANLDVYQFETLYATGATLIGTNADNTWTINSPNSGNVAGITFNGFQNLTGGDGIDTFNINSSIGNIRTGNGATNNVTVSAFGQVTGTITGGTGVETIDVSGSVRSIDTGAGNDIITLRLGSNAVGDLSGGDGDDVFTIDGAVTGYLYGNAGDDLFTIIQGSVTGQVDGGSQSTALGDRLFNDPARTVIIGGGLGQNNISITDIEGVVSTGGTLAARNGFNTTWDITGSDAGIAVERDNSNNIITTLSFTGYKNLNGSDGNDTFNVTVDGLLTGEISAGSGTNSLNITLNPTRQNGQVYYIGGAGNDAVTITGTSSTVAYTPSLNLGSNTYDRLAYTGTNTVPNTFLVNYTPASVETVTDQVTAGTLAVNGTGGSDTITLGNATFTVNGSRTVNYSNKSNLIVDAGLGGNDRIVIADNISITNNLTLKNAATLTQAATTTLMANELMLDSITTFLSPLGTAINSLSLVNSGAATINESGAVQLNQINVAGPLTVIANGDITDTNTHQRNVGGALTLSTTGAGNILLNTPNQNYFNGPISLDGGRVEIDNNVATNFASVNAASLLVNSAGNITQTGAITVTGDTTLTARNSTITLTNDANNFNSLNVTAASVVSVTDTDSIGSGTITADNVTLSTKNGIGTIGVPLVTNTPKLVINNTVDNGVYVTNNGTATVGITNLGNIAFTNNGNLTIDRLYTNGGLYSSPGPYTGDIDLVVNNGVIGAYVGNPAYSGLTYHLAETAPDIVAQNLDVTVINGTFGSSARPMSLSVFDTFTYFGGQGYVHYYLGRIPLREEDVGNSLIRFSSIGGLTSQLLLEIESLGEFDPAIFTAIRNYYYEDVAIMMPADQRLDGSDEDEEEKQMEKEKEKL